MDGSPGSEDRDRPRAVDLVRSIVVDAQLTDPLYRLVAVDIYQDAETVTVVLAS
jgi:hypothetical protein